MLKRIASFSSHYPKTVLFLWFCLFIVSLPLSLQVGSILSNDAGLAPNSQAHQVAAIITQDFVQQANYELIITAEALDSNLSAEELGTNLQVLAEAIRNLPKIRDVQTNREQPLIPTFDDSDNSLMLIELGTTERDDILTVTEDIVSLLPDSGPLQFFLTGWPAIELELQAISARDALRAEVIGLSISLVVLVLVFGAVVAALLPILVAIMTIVLSLAMLFLVGQLGPIANFATTIISLLGLATGIDYALLMVNRYREELAAGFDPKTAAARTTTTAGKAVSVSGLTVLIALAALLIPPLEYIRSMGVSSIITMFFSVSISITVLPAIFTLLGHNINRLQISRKPPGTRSRQFWRNRARSVLKRPLIWTVTGIAVLLVLSLPALSMQVDFSGIRGLTEQTSATQAQAVLDDLQVSQYQRSIDLLVDFGERGFYHPASVRAISQLNRSASGIQDVEQVLSPMAAGNLPSLLLYQYYLTPESALNSPLEPLVNATVAQDGRYVLTRVFPTAYVSPAVIEGILHELRQTVNDQHLTVLWAGSHVTDHEWTQALYSSFPLAVLLVYLATFILLGLAFKSILIPLKSILLNTLVVAAAFGIITLVFQHGWLAPLFGISEGFGFVEAAVPIFIFAVVFGLSMDYEVFLVSRIYEAHERGLSDREAVTHALSVTGNVISSAALIMIIVFSMFIFSHVVLIKTLSLGLTIAVFLDATLVRSVLVPAVMDLAGRWNWWLPRPVARIAKRINFGHD